MRRCITSTKSPQRFRANDTVLIERAGDVIPYVVRVTRKRSRARNNLRCRRIAGLQRGYRAQRTRGRLLCVNANCPARMRESIRHFASKNCLDIEGLGDKLVGNLIEAGLVKELDDLFG